MECVVREIDLDQHTFIVRALQGVGSNLRRATGGRE